MGDLGDKFAFIGDSYTSGYLLPNPTSQCWAALFSAAMGASENNVAVPSSGFVKEGSGGASRFVEQAARIPADSTRVFICGGINDAGLNPTECTVASEVAATVAQVQATAPDAGITILSPMWWAAEPSDALLQVEAYIRKATPASVTFIEGGPWIRFERDELQYSDGHPNPAGHAVIASWVQDRVVGPRPGAVEGAAVRPGTTDAPFTGTANLAQGTVRDAAPGWWLLEGTAVLYGAASGFFYVAGGSHQYAIRSDVTATPAAHHHAARYYHPGGDLSMACGYVDSSGTVTVVASGNTRVSARKVG